MSAPSFMICRCGGSLVECHRDTDKGALTLKCGACQHCSVAGDGHLIHLTDFHLKRGPKLQPIDEFAMANEMVKLLGFDRSLTPAMVCDWGIDTSAQYDLFKRLVTEEVPPYVFDRVIADGPAITQLVRSVLGSQSAKFKTAYDSIYERLQFETRHKSWSD